jgi:hypothetical protein
MKLRPDDHGAMFYMSLMYLEKAAVECDDLTTREEDQKTAGAWINKLEFGVSVKARKGPFGETGVRGYGWLWKGCRRSIQHC